MLAAVAMFIAAARARRARARAGAVRRRSSRARYGRRSRPALQEVQQRIAELTADAEENVSGVRVVKAFAREERQLRALPPPRRARLRPVDARDAAARLLQRRSSASCPNLGLAAILLVGGRQVINGSLTLGDFTAFYAYLLMLIGPMRTLGFMLGAGAARDRLGRAHLPDARPRAADRRAGGRAAAARRARAASSCATSRSTYRGRGEPALRDVDLDVEAGTTVALVGATGSGKTTLVSAAPAALRPDRRARC